MRLFLGHLIPISLIFAPMKFRLLFFSKVVFSLALFLSANSSAQPVKINEVVSSNALFQDEDGDTPDWIELHNTSGLPVSLNGYSITDNKEDTTKWIFPDVVLGADEYLLVWASGKNRVTTGIPFTLINQGDIFQYIVPASSINDNWKLPGFNGSGWSEGATGIGYNDGDDATLVPTGTIAIFARKSFVIDDPGSINELILDIDYDDSFVAYINGREIGRANVNGSPPAYNATAFTGHEAEMYTGGSPNRYVISNASEVLVEGENVLAIQVHNLSSSSSDMTLIPCLSVISTSTIDYGIEPPEILQLKPYYLHTGFKISSSGETLYLYDSVGTLVDSLVVPPMTADVSFGVEPGSGNYLLYEPPTPGQPNEGNTYLGFITDTIQFSHQGGITDRFGLSLGPVEPPAEIRYTLDATEPNENSQVYSGPIDILTTTVVRAAIFRPDYLPSDTQSRTYILGNTSHVLPIVSLVSDPYNLFDEDYGMYALGTSYENSFPYFGANFWEDWERPISFTLYEPGGELGVSINAGAKIFGGWSRGNEQKSMAIYARGSYGFSSLDYPVFPDNPYQSYQALVLRNSGNDWLNVNMRDGVLTGLLKGSGIEHQAYRPSVTYINGEYWGIYNIREKINEHFLASKANVSADEVDLLEFNGDIIHGDNADYLQMLSFLNSNSLVNEANYEFIASKIDVDNFILYQVFQIYINNTDWPGNNIKYWRAAGGKWRWIVYDTDFGFGVWNRDDYWNNTLAFALESNGPGWPNPPWSTLLFRKLVANQEFRNAFVSRYADELNTRFLPRSINVHLDSLAAHIQPEIAAHYERWGSNYSTWQNNLNNMKYFANYRPAVARSHIISQFGLSGTHKLQVTNPITSFGSIQVNSINITQSEWEGVYFGGVPVKITAKPVPGYKFVSWTGSVQSDSRTLEINMTGDMALYANFMPEAIIDHDPIINEINYNSSLDRDTKDWVEIYNPNEVTLDLSGWTLKDSNDLNFFVLPAQSYIEPNDYMVICRDKVKFQSMYPKLENVVGDFDFGLSSTGDDVRLFNDSGELIDYVSYGVSSPWPTEPNGMGPTLELINPFVDNFLAANWQPLHPYGSPGKTNLTITAIEDDEIARQGVMQVYPTPFDSDLNIRLHVVAPTSVRITLHNINGSELALIYQGNVNKGEHLYTKTLKDLPSGIYLVRMISKAGDVQTIRTVRRRN